MLVKATLSAVLLAAAVLVGVGGAAEPPSFALVGPSQADSVLSRVDPVTLRPSGRTLRLGSFSAERALSPDRTMLAIVSQDRPVVRFVDLRRMRATGVAVLSTEGEVQSLRWTEEGLVALVDLPVGSKLVWLDPGTRKLTRTLRYRGELVDPRLVAGRLVVVEWPSRRVDSVRLDVVERDGRARSARIARIAGGWARRGNEITRVAEPGLAVDPTGKLAWLADGDGEICEVVLETFETRCNTVRRTAKSGAPWSRRQLRLVGEATLALSGWEKPTAGPKAAKSIGLWLVDTRTWSRRLLDPGIDSFRFSGGVLVGVRRNGVTAYGSDGERRYAIEEPLQLGVISTTGPYLYVPRTDSSTVVAELSTGAVLRRSAKGSTPFQDLDTR